MGVRVTGRAAVYAAAVMVAGAAAVSPASAATIGFDNGGANNAWETNTNWVGDVLPGVGDSASLTSNSTPGVNGDLTVNLSSAQSVGDVAMVDLTATAPAANVAGTTTLNILTGAVLTVGDVGTGNNSGMRVGRGIQSALLGSSTARVLQTGGEVQFTIGSNGVRLSASDAGNVADSLYQISDGRLRGANGTANALADLRVGATGVAYNRAEFHVVGSGPDEIRVLDVQVADSNAVANTSNTNGRSVFHWSLDAGGVTPIVAEDEFQFRAGTAGAVPVGLLQVDLIGEAPQADVTLVIADRLGNNGSALERFFNYADGDPLIATGAGWEYTYTVDYTDASDNFQTVGAAGLDASIVLHYVSRTAIPEPGGVALIAFGGLALARRRRA